MLRASRRSLFLKSKPKSHKPFSVLPSRFVYTKIKKIQHRTVWTAVRAFFYIFGTLYLSILRPQPFYASRFMFHDSKAALILCLIFCGISMPTLSRYLPFYVVRKTTVDQKVLQSYQCKVSFFHFFVHFNSLKSINNTHLLHAAGSFLRS